MRPQHKCHGCGADVILETWAGVTVPVCTLSHVCPGRCAGLILAHARKNGRQTDLLLVKVPRDGQKCYVSSTAASDEMGESVTRCAGAVFGFIGCASR